LLAVNLDSSLFFRTCARESDIRGRFSIKTLFEILLHPVPIYTPVLPAVLFFRGLTGVEAQLMGKQIFIAARLPLSFRSPYV